jgi:hypothetical protein
MCGQSVVGSKQVQPLGNCARKSNRTKHSIDHSFKCARASAAHTCVTCGLSRGFPELVHAKALLLLLGVHEVLRRTDRLLPSLHTRARA